jgi:hypothetical protein
MGPKLGLQWHYSPLPTCIETSVLARCAAHCLGELPMKKTPLVQERKHKRSNGQRDTCVGTCRGTDKECVLQPGVRAKEQFAVPR